MFARITEGLAFVEDVRSIAETVGPDGAAHLYAVVILNYRPKLRSGKYAAGPVKVHLSVSDYGTFYFLQKAAYQYEYIRLDIRGFKTPIPFFDAAINKLLKLGNRPQYEVSMRNIERISIAERSEARKIASHVG